MSENIIGIPSHKGVLDEATQENGVVNTLFLTSKTLVARLIAEVPFATKSIFLTSRYSHNFSVNSLTKGPSLVNLLESKALSRYL